MHPRRSTDRFLFPFLFLLAFRLAVASGAAATGENVILQLKSGDRVSGAVVSQDVNHLVLSNRWSRELSVPLDEIVLRYRVSPAPAAGAPRTNAPVAVATAGTNHWKGEAQVGVNLFYGARDRQDYYARFKLGYERPYRSGSKKFFRNAFDFSMDYGRTEGVKSSDRLNSSDKSAFDTRDRWYLYNLAGIGFDHIQKIDLQYEDGPGVGYHLLTRTNFTLNLENGFNYQVQERRDSPAVRDFYWRWAEDLAWKIRDRLTLAEKLDVFPRVDFQVFRIRFESTLSYELWRHLAWNLTLLELFDTRPAPGVNENELQIRSSLGVKF